MSEQTNYMQVVNSGYYIVYDAEGKEYVKITDPKALMSYLTELAHNQDISRFTVHHVLDVTKQFLWS